MKVLIPNEDTKKFYIFHSGKIIIFMTNEFGGIHPFPYLGYLDGIFELDHCQFHPICPSILIFHHSPFKNN
jgi:hypothetical protein